MAARILVAEDDRKQADFIRRFLERDGYVTSVVHDGRAALDEARRQPPDLIVLDIMMPELDGLNVCRELQARHDIPIIFLTARTSEEDVLTGLAVGADDYVSKPYSPMELVARVRTVLRRAARAGRPDSDVYHVRDLTIDLARREVHVRGEAVDTTRAEFNIVARLAAAPGRAFTRQLLLAQVSDLGHDTTARTIDFHVMNLRRKIEQEPTRPEYVQTVYGVGYKMADAPGDGANDAS
jgi:DNA-binding response OmpR family regulator